MIEYAELFPAAGTWHVRFTSRAAREPLAEQPALVRLCGVGHVEVIPNEPRILSSGCADAPR